MASSEHLQLAQIIKSTHQKLRNDAKQLGANDAWKKHCGDSKMLKNYSEAMQKLATKHWEKNYMKKDSGIKSRVEWIYNFCDYYFFKGELLRQQIREQDIAKKINLPIKIDPTTGCCDCNKILKLLDVGSCYNPFKTFSCFDVLAIDIAPASEDVYECDFLNLNIVDHHCTEIDQKQIFNLQQCTFNVVVFSLLLEYLPCPEQRMLCCINAYKLLKFEGLLIIITPDSKHVGANAKIMKSWRYNLAHLGFSRIKYEKLPHIHCMAFRKSLRLEIADRWTKLQNEEFFDKMFIPQDFNIIDNENINKNEDSFIDIENKLIMLSELPQLVE